MNSATECAPPRAVQIAYTLVFASAVAVSIYLAKSMGIAMFQSLAVLGSWCVLVAIVSLIARLSLGKRIVIVGLGVAGAFGIYKLGFSGADIAIGATNNTVRLSTGTLVRVAERMLPGCEIVDPPRSVRRLQSPDVQALPSVGAPS